MIKITNRNPLSLEEVEKLRTVLNNFFHTDLQIKLQLKDIDFIEVD